MIQLFKLKTLLIVLLCFSMSACGFHLRGTDSIGTDKVVYIDAPHGTFEQQLSDDLRISGAQLSNVAANSDLHIKVSQAQLSRDIGTLNERGTVDSYKLNFTVSYSVLDSEGKLIKAPQTLTETRQYIFNPAAIVESESEEQALRLGMEKELSLRIIRHLSALNAK